MRWLDGIIDPMDMSLSELRELVMEGRPGVLQSMGLELDTTERLNRTDLQSMAEVRLSDFRGQSCRRHDALRTSALGGQYHATFGFHPS